MLARHIQIALRNKCTAILSTETDVMDIFFYLNPEHQEACHYLETPSTSIQHKSTQVIFASRPLSPVVVSISLC